LPEAANDEAKSDPEHVPRQVALARCRTASLTGCPGGEIWAGLALSTLSGFLWFLSCTPFDFPALSWIAMVPVLFVVVCASTRLRAALFSWWAGAVMGAVQGKSVGWRGVEPEVTATVAQV